jgi:hypothetical protein
MCALSVQAFEPWFLAGRGSGAAPWADGLCPFVFGFADLKARLQDWMGDPISCEFADPNSSGHVHQ